jgi:hypothetical protein
MNTNTAEMIVRIKHMHSQLEEASAKGFRENPRAMNLVSEIKDAVERLEELVHAEFRG